MATISLDHARVMSEVNRLRTIASDLQRIQTDARNALNEMNAFWEGAAANAFTSANEQWRREMRTIESEITELAELIRRVADEIKAAEARARAIITGG